MPQQHYKNWKAVTDADYVSMFIKTWFAYISTLRTMFPEAYNRRGDGKYLNAFKDFCRIHYSGKLAFSDESLVPIEALYREGRKVIMEQYPEYYLWDFYHINEDFKYEFKDIPPDRSDCLIIGLKMNRNRGTKWSFILSGFVRFFGNYYGEDYNGNVRFSCNISEILRESEDFVRKNPTTSEQDYLSWIIGLITDALTSAVVDSFKNHCEENDYSKRILLKVNSVEKRALSILWQNLSLNNKDDTFKTIDEMNLPRNSYEIIQQRPINYYVYHMDVDLQPKRDLKASEEQWYKELMQQRKRNSILWFLDFVYRLRNALFHEIIDPLDEEWQLIFKNAYLVLKEVVDLNIGLIQDGVLPKT